MAQVAQKTFKSKELVLYPKCRLLGREHAQKMLAGAALGKAQLGPGVFIRSAAHGKMPA